MFVLYIILSSSAKAEDLRTRRVFREVSGAQSPAVAGDRIPEQASYSAASNSGTWVISGTSTMPLSVMRISGMTDSGIRLKPM